MFKQNDFGFMRYLFDLAELTHEEMTHISGMLKKSTVSFQYSERYRDGEEECVIELKEGYANTLCIHRNNQWENIVVKKFNIIIDWPCEDMTLQLFGPGGEVIEEDFINPSNKFTVTSLARGWMFDRQIKYIVRDEEYLQTELERNKQSAQGIVLSWMDKKDVRWVLDFIFKINVRSHYKYEDNPLNSSYIFIVKVDNYYQVHATSKGQKGIESFKSINNAKVVYMYKCYVFSPYISTSVYNALEENTIEIKIGKGPRNTYLDMPLNDIVKYIETVY